MTLSVLVTVDTESFTRGTPEAQIWARAANGEEFGIRRIMDLLERRGMRGTFYVNVYEAERVGTEAIREVIRSIDARGHDVELHTHPHDRYGVFKVSRASPEKQREILAWGKAFIEEVIQRPVVAHRAGAFAANRDTIEALAAVGIPIDASLSSAWDECDLARQVPSPNQPFRLGGVLELPATHFVQARLGRRKFLRMVDIEACSLRELKSVIRQARRAGVSSVNLLMHSHSFLRDGRPRRAPLRRLERLLDFLAAQPGVVVETTREFAARRDGPSLVPPAPRPFEPCTGWALTYLRCVESAATGWMNAVVAFVPPVAIAAAGGLLWHWWR
jgi:peptidoglycan/xylan/chitin deacetylase (PgdA/CDA1 family)